jgi:26S proteasome regulatory subunit N3
MECGSQKSNYGFDGSDVFSRRIGYCTTRALRLVFFIGLLADRALIFCTGHDIPSQRPQKRARCEGARERENQLAKEIQDGELDDEEGGLGGDF